MTFYEKALQYVEDVMSGKEVVCNYVRLAVERHVADLKRQGPASGFWFDERSAKLYCEAMRLFRHTSGEFAGERFNLMPFQAFAFMCIFGWKRYIDGKPSRYRRFTRVYWETAKKSGKSEIAAAIQWLCALLDREAAAQIYSAATTRDQARHVFRAAQIMAKYLRQDSLSIRKKVNINKFRMYVEETETFIEALASDSRTLDGINTHVGIIDEYHAHDTPYVSDIVLNSMVARMQPLHFVITTAGFNLQGPCYRSSRAEAVNVLDGKVKNEALFVYIFTLDDGDDWQDPEVWKKANPNIGRTVKMSNMMDLYTAAKNGGPSKEVDFKTKNLNVWVHSQYNWIPDEVFMKAKMDVSIQDMADRGVMCWGGMDLGQTRDLTCVALLFDPEMNGGKFIFHLFTWCAEETVEAMSSRGFPYKEWYRSGILDVTPGPVTDYDYIRKKLNEVRDMVTIYNIGYDPANSTQIAIGLTQDGFNLERFSQGIMNMNAPTRTLEELFFDGKVGHDGNELMRYMFQNVELIRDSTGNIKITKKEADKKVDGAVAMVMALGQYMEYQRTVGGLYKEGIRFI